MMRRGSALVATAALTLALHLPAQADTTTQGATGGDNPLCAAQVAEVASSLNGDWTLETVLIRVHTQMGSKREDGGPVEPVTLEFGDDGTGAAQVGPDTFNLGLHPVGGLAIATRADHFRAFADAAKTVADQAAAATVNCALRDLPQIYADMQRDTADIRIEMILLNPDLMAGGLVSVVPAKTAGAPPSRFVSAVLLRRNAGADE